MTKPHRGPGLSRGARAPKFSCATPIEERQDSHRAIFDDAPWRGRGSGERMLEEMTENSVILQAAATKDAMGGGTTKW